MEVPTRKNGMIRRKRVFFFRTGVLLLLAAWADGAPPFVQEPVTGGEQLIRRVRALREAGGGAHPEWLYLEDRVDQRPDQKRLVRGGQPLEFSDGYLYHGREGLDDILISGWIPGICYLTRAPHVWAIGPFHESSTGPAIFQIDSESFNRGRDAGQAALEAEIAQDAGVMDPYPKFISGFPLEQATEIWIDEDTAERYDRLLAVSGAEGSPREEALRRAVRRLREKQRFRVLPGLRHTTLSEADFFPSAYEAVGAYFTGRGLEARIPGFRRR